MTNHTTREQLIDGIRMMAAKLDPNHLPTGLTKLRKAELVELHSALFDQYMVATQPEVDALHAQADFERQMGLDHDPAEDDANDAMYRTQFAPLHEQPMADSPAAIARAEEDDHRDGCECEDCEEFYADEAKHDGIAAPMKSTAERDAQYREELDGVWDEVEALTSSETDPEFAAEVDALVARELAADVPSGLIERTQFATNDPLLFAAKFPVTETDVAVSNVAVVVQSGSKLIWGKLIAVVNRRTRYLPPFLCTVELESGVRQLVAADDILAA